MHIAHIALWTQNLEKTRRFYTVFFNGVSNAKYTNASTGFSSYFITFPKGPTLELMQRKDIKNSRSANCLGYCHIAFKLGSKQAVVDTTQALQVCGIKVISFPRVTGDGYFESVVEDPEGNHVELIA